jgi:hypothetical protein
MLIGKHQLLVSSEDANLLGDIICTVKQQEVIDSYIMGSIIN